MSSSNRSSTSSDSSKSDEYWIPKVLVTHKEIPSSGIDLLRQKYVYNIFLF